MYCPTCGLQNSGENEIRFCRSCGADLRAVSRAINRSLPVRLAASLDSYFENRFQQNLRNGVLNLVAFVALLVVGIGHLASGWTGLGIFMLVLSVISILIERHNLVLYAKVQKSGDCIDSVNYRHRLHFQNLVALLVCLWLLHAQPRCTCFSFLGDDKSSSNL